MPKGNCKSPKPYTPWVSFVKKAPATTPSLWFRLLIQENVNGLREIMATQPHL